MPGKDMNELRKMFEAIDKEHGGALRRMAESNGALLKEYREGIERIAWCEENGRPIDTDFAQSVEELHDEIVRRMNR